ncbi:MAG: hypothetical protein WKG07_47135 [Hymenobacter sp.]
MPRCARKDKRGLDSISRYYVPYPLTPLTEFASFYLYGLTDNPYRQSTDLAKFGELYNLVIGDHGGLSLSSSFHPYQLVNPAGRHGLVRSLRSALRAAQPSRVVRGNSRRAGAFRGGPAGRVQRVSRLAR